MWQWVSLTRSNLLYHGVTLTLKATFPPAAFPESTFLDRFFEEYTYLIVRSRLNPYWHLSIIKVETVWRPLEGLIGIRGMRTVSVLAHPVRTIAATKLCLNAFIMSLVPLQIWGASKIRSGITGNPTVRSSLCLYRREGPQNRGVCYVGGTKDHIILVLCDRWEGVRDIEKL